MKQQYVPVNLEESAQQLQDLETQSNTTEDGRPVLMTEDGRPVLIAVAVPDTIRPPKVSYSDDSATEFSIIRSACIITIGIFLTYITFFESLLFMLAGAATSSWLEFFLGLVWFVATLGILAGSIIGFLKSKWRFLVPGLVLQHVMSTIIKIIVTDVPDDDEQYYII